jgi:hypothetical protein
VVSSAEELEEAVDYMTKLIQAAATISIPAIEHHVPESHNIPLHVKELVFEKRRPRRRWQNSRYPLDKTYLNRLTHNLLTAIRRKKMKHSIIISQNFLQTAIQYGRQYKNIKGR